MCSTPAEGDLTQKRMVGSFCQLIKNQRSKSKEQTNWTDQTQRSIWCFNNSGARRADVRQQQVMPAHQNTKLQLLIDQKTQLVGNNFKCEWLNVNDVFPVGCIIYSDLHIAGLHYQVFQRFLHATGLVEYYVCKLEITSAIKCSIFKVIKLFLFHYLITSVYKRIWEFPCILQRLIEQFFRFGQIFGHKNTHNFTLIQISFHGSAGNARHAQGPRGPLEWFSSSQSKLSRLATATRRL